MTKAELRKLRIDILRNMDLYIRSINDEYAMNSWLMCGIPDGGYEEDLEYIADDYESFPDVFKLFGYIVKLYIKSEDDEYTE